MATISNDSRDFDVRKCVGGAFTTLVLHLRCVKVNRIRLHDARGRTQTLLRATFILLFSIVNEEIRIVATLSCDSIYPPPPPPPRPYNADSIV